MSIETHPDIRRTLLFLVREDEILLAMKKRGFGEGKWNGVGGKIEAGESVEDALIRECQEEIGVTPLSWQKVAELDFIQDAASDPWHMYVHAYLCDKWEGEPTESEEMAPQWYKQSEVPYDKMWHDDKYWLGRVLGGEILKGSFTFDENNNMLTHELHETLKFEE